MFSKGKQQIHIKGKDCISAQYTRVSRCFQFITTLPQIKHTQGGQFLYDKWNQLDSQQADIMTELHHTLIIQAQNRIRNKEGQNVYEYTLTGDLINWKRIHFSKGDSKCLTSGSIDQ